MTKRIAYTGASGSLGSCFPKSDNFKPLLSRLEDNLDELVKEFSQIKPEVYIHLAGLTGLRECEENITKAYNLNVESAVKFYKAASLSGVKRFIFVSSSHVYAPKKGRHICTISSDLNPRSVYGKTKLEAEKKLATCSKRLKIPDLSVVRLFSLVSTLMRPNFLITNLHIRAKNNDFSEIEGLDYYRDFITAEEAASKLILLANSDKYPRLVNLCSGKPTKIRELANGIFSEYGHKNFHLVQGPRKKEDIEFLVGKPTPIE